MNNFRNVDVWGQSTSSYPSMHPHIRAITGARSAGVFGSSNTYFVGGNPGEGRRAHWFWPGFPSSQSH